MHTFIGTDDYLTEKAARKVLDGFIPADLRTSALEIIDGRASNEETQLASLAACRASVAAPPFLDPVKATWWRGVDFLPGGGKNGAITESVKTALETFIASLAEHPLPENQMFVITATKLLPTSVVAKKLAGISSVDRFASEEKSGARQQNALAALPDLAAAEKLTFAPGADVAFVSKVGSDTRTTVSELAKLRAYLGTERNQVTMDDVATITSAAGENPEFWSFNDAIDRRDPNCFMQVYARFADTDIAIPVLSTVERHLRELIVIKDAVEHQWVTIYGWKQNLPEDIQQMLNATSVGPATMRQVWMIKKKVVASNLYTLNELVRAHARVIRARARVVSGGDKEEFVSTLLQIIRKPKK